MNVADDRVRSLFVAGEFGRLAKEWEKPPETRTLTPTSLAYVAFAAMRVGRDQQAQEILTSLERRTGASSQGAMAHVVWGLLCRSRGKPDLASNHLQLAVALAGKEDNAEHLAWAQLHLLRHVIDFQAQGVAALVRTTRATVYGCGSASLMAYLHIVIATFEGQAGSFSESERHCEAAMKLVETEPHAWLKSLAFRNKATVAMTSGYLARAVENVNSARALASRHDLLQEAVASAINSGYLELLKGDYARSRNTLQEVMDSPLAPAMAKLAALDSLSRVALALGDLGSCARILTEILGAMQPLDSYVARHLAITSARLQLKRGQPEAAVADIQRSRAEVQKHDKWWAPTADLLLSQAHARLGDSKLSARHLVAAERSGASQAGGVQGQYYYAAAATIDATDPLLATLLRDRARRLWKHQGIVSLEHEMEDVPPPKPTWRGARRSPAVAINALGTALDLAHAPRLLGAELVRTLQGLQLKATVTADDKPRPEHALTLPLGQENGQNLTLVCEAPERPDAAILALDVLRVGRAAIELEAFREEERKRSALWPEDPIEEQMGALFVSQEMRDVLSMVRRIAETTVPVLITGETGTGKEVIAKIIHAYSPRAKAPFFAFNCASMPRDMLDSQLFGHRRGAFTGAVEHFPGVIRTTDRGTLLLDEIGDMSLDVQPKLLRFLESGEVHPVGEARPTKVDVRVIAATNAKLSSMVSQGLFREDLLYRLNIVEIPIPPLRERRVDIPVLANHYLKKYAEENRKGALRISEDAMEHLLLYRWPGNVRQLANEMRRAAAVAEAGGLVTTEHFSADLATARRTVAATDRSPNAHEATVRLDQPLAAAMECLERAMIRYALNKCGGRIEETANLLGMSRKGLYLKRQRYEMDPPASARRVSA